MGRSRAGVGQRRQGGILCHYATRGRLSRDGEFCDFDFQVAVGAALLRRAMSRQPRRARE
eukprot:1719339-Lingulodinium_polyedra.AAC.1